MSHIRNPEKNREKGLSMRNSPLRALIDAAEMVYSDGFPKR